MARFEKRALIAICLTLLFTLSFLTPLEKVFAANVSVDVSALASVLYYPSQRKMVKDSNGYLYVAYCKISGTKYAIYVRNSTDGGTSWRTPEMISNATGMSSYDQQYPAIAVDSNNNILVVWSGAATSSSNVNGIFFAKCTSTWAAPVNLDGQAGYYQTAPAICVDTNNYYYVVWGGRTSVYQTYYQVMYTKYISSWSAPARISTEDTMQNYYQYFPAVEVDSNSYVNVVWFGGDTTYSGSIYQVWFTQYTNAWSTPVRISTYLGMNGYGEAYPSIAVDSNNNIEVVFNGKATGYTTNDQTWLAEKVGAGSWTNTLVSTGLGAKTCQLATVAAVGTDLRVMFEQATDHNIYLANRVGGTWSGPILIDNSGKDQTPSLRGSRYPSSNSLTIQADYLFCYNNGVNYNLYYNSVGISTVAVSKSLSLGRSLVANLYYTAGLAKSFTLLTSISSTGAIYSVALGKGLAFISSIVSFVHYDIGLSKVVSFANSVSAFCSYNVALSGFFVLTKIADAHIAYNAVLTETLTVFRILVLSINSVVPGGGLSGQIVDFALILGLVALVLALMFSLRKS